MTAVMHPYWLEAASSLTQLAASSTLLPPGTWPRELDSAARYEDSAPVQIGAEVETIVIHKADLPCFAKTDVHRLLQGWKLHFANEVFVVFHRGNATPIPSKPAHIEPLRTYIDPKAYWSETGGSGALLHIPKCGGTSIWSAIAGRSRSTLYFRNAGALESFDGDINAFQFIGGHVSLKRIIAKGWHGPIFTIIRDPIERALSAIGHARRADEDIATFSQEFLTLRQEDGDSAARLQVLVAELNLMTVALGGDVATSMRDPVSAAACLNSALESVFGGTVQVGLLERIDLLAGSLSGCFSGSFSEIPKLNQTVGRDSLAGPADRVALSQLASRFFCSDIALYPLVSGFLSK